MNDRLTPETDAACNEVYAQGVAHIPLVGFMEKLERERDEARHLAERFAVGHDVTFHWEDSQAQPPAVEGGEP